MDSTYSDCLAASGLPGKLVAAETLCESGGNRSRTRLELEDSVASSLILVTHPLDDASILEERAFCELATVFNSGQRRYAPHVYYRNPEAGYYFVEDLGDTRLLEYLSDSRGARDQRTVLEDVLKQLLALQLHLRKSFKPAMSAHHACTPGFLRRWESGYFQKEFLEGFLGQAHSVPLSRELDELCVHLEGLTGFDGVMLRDVQSTNLMLDANGCWRFIDFQGARTGPWHYDVLSLLFDPYAGLPATTAWELLEGYAKRAVAAGLIAHAGTFLREAPLVGVHRLLQALGAYGKLGGRDGKVWFLQWIPVALKHAVELAERLPEGQVPHLLESLLFAQSFPQGKRLGKQQG